MPSRSPNLNQHTQRRFRCDEKLLRLRRAVKLSVVLLIVANCVHAIGQQSPPRQSDFPAFEDLMKGVKPESRQPPANRSGNVDRRSTRPSGELPPIGNDRSDSGDRFPSERDSNTRFRNDDIPQDRDGARNLAPNASNYQFGPPESDRRVPLPAERESTEDIEATDEVEVDPTGFNWAEQTVSVADLKFPKLPGSDRPSSKVFEHGQPFLTVPEESAYQDMLDAIAKQRLALLKRTASDMKNTVQGAAVWEKAFYQYANARELAWDNGHLRTSTEPMKLNGLPNPFEREEPTTTSSADFDLLSDIRRFPQHYVGRPIVIYGRYTAGSIVRLGADKTYVNSVSEGPDESTKRQEVSLMRGTLSLLGGGAQLAMVDTKGLQTPEGRLGLKDWPAGQSSIPVMVKGWVVKKWDQQPLIYCEALRQLSPLPHVQLVKQNTVPNSRLREEETWIYYETLRQLQLTSKSQQRQIAAEVRQQRITHLMEDIQKRTAQDEAALRISLKNGKITDAEFDQRRSGLLRRLGSRLTLYRKLKKNPQNFQTFVDMFNYPDVYHGYPVTLHGHVRHVVKYPGDDVLFGGRPLYELWLFTDDSQHIPTVIVTPDLPEDFPREADVVDRVSVTGCFFKRYVYGSQDTARVAPLVLAGSVDWTPTVSQVQALVEAGHLPANKPRAKKAAALAGQGMSRGMLMLIGFAFLMTLMILWGRSQREERDRIRLRKRVNEVTPEFESPAMSGYSLPVSEYGPEL